MTSARLSRPAAAPRGALRNVENLRAGTSFELPDQIPKKSERAAATSALFQNDSKCKMISVNMAKIVLIHGIGHQYGGEEELLDDWYSALCDGLHRAHHSELPSRSDCRPVFYGDVFRKRRTLGELDSTNIEIASEEDKALLEAVWRAAADVSKNETKPVPPPEDFGRTLLIRVPDFVRRGLNALARSRYCADYTPLQLFGDLKQVVQYLNNDDIHREVLGRATAAIADDTRIVIGHSLGSVVAYEAVCANSASVVGLLTLGSPLGIANVLFDKLRPSPNAMRVGHWPGQVRKWTNIADSGDIVAAKKMLVDLFPNPPGVNDTPVYNGWDAHNSIRYLNTEETGRAIAQAL
jgi:hypothetical protein